MKNEKQDIQQKDDALYEFNADKFLKKFESGHTFYSFISGDEVYFVGYLKGYVNIKDTSEISDELELYGLFNEKDILQKFKVIEVKSTFKYPIWKLKSIPNYKPISVSVNKFNAVILYSKNEMKRILREEFKEFKELFEEVKNNLKSKGHSFQKYFLEYQSNDVLYQVGGSSLIEDNRYSIPEIEFREKCFDIISYSNNDKLNFLMNKFLEKLKHTGISVNGKIEITEVHQIVNSDIYHHTKTLIIGEFVVNYKKNIQNLDFFDNWNSFYNKSFTFEMPIVLIPLRQIEIGDNHVIMLTVEGEIFSFGDGLNGATGNGIMTYHYKPVKVKFQYNTISIIRISAGGRHNLAIDSNFNLYSWGSGKNGRLGHDNEKDQNYPKAIESISNSKIIFCSAGDTYSCAITQDNYLYTWGSGEFGRLGHEGNTDEYIPKQIEDIEAKFLTAYCSHYCLTAMTIKNEVYLFGGKSLFMKIDQNKKENSENLILIDVTENIKKIEIINKNETQLLNVSAGYQFISCMTKEEVSIEEFKFSENNNKKNKNELYFWGNLNMVASEYRPFFQNWKTIAEKNLDDRNYSDTEMIKSKNFMKNIANTYNTDNYQIREKLIQDEENKIKSRISDRKTGYEGLKKYFSDILNRIKLNNNQINNVNEESNSKYKEMGAKKVICSENNTTVLSYDGNLYCFGSYINKLATDKVDQLFFPIQPRGVKVSHVGVGSNHILLVTNNYEVFGKGRNKEGQLGITNTNFVNEFTLVSKLKNKGVKKVYCMENYSAVLSYLNEVILFGDIFFLLNSKHVNNQIVPKEMPWGIVYKIALGPSHILFIGKDNNSDKVYLKAVGNGTFGKLGDGNEFEDNRYEPVIVDIAFPNSFKEDDKWQNVKILCSKHNSAILICERNKKKTLFVWGLYPKTIFNLRDLDRIMTNMTKVPRNLKENMVVQPRPIQATIWEEIMDVYLSETSITVLTTKNEIKSIGTFFSLMNDKNPPKFNLPTDFIKLSIGLDHAAGISLQDKKVFTWGFNVMNKLGIVKKEQTGNFTIDNDYDNYNKFLYTTPQSIVELNKMFSELKQNQNAVETVVEEENIQDPLKKPNVESELKDKKQEGLIDNVYVITQNNIKDFEKFEVELRNKEIKFKQFMKKLLESYAFLLEKENQTRNLKNVLNNQFHFKYGDPPINVQFKKGLYSKLPKEYSKYRRNYKALLTTLKFHPCYLEKIYNKSLLDEKELYIIIKSLYDPLFDDNYSQSLMIILINKLFTAKLLKEKEKFTNGNVEGENKDFLEVFKLYKIESGIHIFDLVGNLCRRFFKLQKDHIKRMECLAIYLISYIYQKIGSKGAGFNIETAMLISYNPRSKGKDSQNLSDVISTIINSRIDVIHIVIDWFINLISTENKDMEIYKDSLFSHNKTKYGPNINEGGYFLQLNRMSLILITEIRKSMITVLGSSEKYKIEDWILRNFPIIFLDEFLYIVEDPEKRLLIDASILVDKNTFTNFIKKSTHNFYSVSFALKNMFIMFSGEDPSSESDIISKLIKKMNDLKLNLYKAIRRIFETGWEKVENENWRLDLISIKSFFDHSLRDESNTINFSLHKLKRLQEVIPSNIEDLRVLNTGYDLLDTIFFNKNKDIYIGLENGLINYNIGIEDDLILQINLKTRVLANANPQTIMRCKNCQALLLDEFNLANEQNFFDDFHFFSSSTKEGCLINVFKNISPIKSEKILDHLKEELRGAKGAKVKDSLTYLCTNIALEQKNTLLLEETDIANSDKILEIILSDKATSNKIFELCKSINFKLEDMKLHSNYYGLLDNTLIQIKENVNEENLRGVIFRNSLYETIKKNLEKGYGNPGLVKFANSLSNSSILVKIVKQIKSTPISKNLNEKLGQSNKEKILPFKEYKLSKLIEDKIIFSVLLENCEANKNPKDFKLLIQKTQDNEFSMTLIQVIKSKTGFWSCGNNKDFSSRKLISYCLSNEEVNLITKYSTSKEKNNSKVIYKIGSFFEVNSKNFINLLKKFSTGNIID